jgi:hypothetical protein
MLKNLAREREHGHAGLRAMEADHAARPRSLSSLETHKRIAHSMIDASEGVEIKNRRYLLSNYSDCFVGSECVNWFIREGLAASRAEAVSLGNTLLVGGYINHVTGDHPFEDAHLFYRMSTVDRGRGQGPGHSHRTLSKQELEATGASLSKKCEMQQQQIIDLFSRLINQQAQLDALQQESNTARWTFQCLCCVVALAGERSLVVCTALAVLIAVLLVSPSAVASRLTSRLFPSSSSAPSARAGDTVEVTKQGAQNGHLGRVTEPSSNGMVKVRMTTGNDIGATKSYSNAHVKLHGADDDNGSGSGGDEGSKGGGGGGAAAVDSAAAALSSSPTQSLIDLHEAQPDLQLAKVQELRALLEVQLQQEHTTGGGGGGDSRMIEAVSVRFGLGLPADRLLLLLLRAKVRGAPESLTLPAVRAEGLESVTRPPARPSSTHAEAAARAPSPAAPRDRLTLAPVTH